jgi:hypothetical protein
MPRCIDCRREIEEGPVCNECAPFIVDTLRLMKLKRRPTRRDYYHRAEPRPEPPVTLPLVRFGKSDKGEAR